MRVRKRTLLSKFFADRGTHLAAMVAYFALLSFVPLVFLALALLGLVHRADASDFLVKELRRAFPGSSVKSILSLVHRVQDNAATLGIVGGVFLLWSSLSLFSALESALNIVYGRPNRSFLKGKARRRRRDDRLDRDALPQPRRRRVRRRGAEALRAGVRRQRHRRVHRLDRRLAARRVRLPARDLSRAAERAGAPARRAARARSSRRSSSRRRSRCCRSSCGSPA